MCLWSGGLGKMGRMKVLVLKLNWNLSHASRITSKKKLLSLGPKLLSHHLKSKGPEVYLCLLHDLFPRLRFLQALPSGKHTLFLSCSPISCRTASLGNDHHSSTLKYKLSTHIHIYETSPQNKMRIKQSKEMSCFSQTIPPF